MSRALPLTQITQKSSPGHRVSGATVATSCPVNTIALFEIRDKGSNDAGRDEGGRRSGVGRLASTRREMSFTSDPVPHRETTPTRSSFAATAIVVRTYQQSSSRGTGERTSCSTVPRRLCLLDDHPQGYATMSKSIGDDGVDRSLRPTTHDTVAAHLLTFIGQG